MSRLKVYDLASGTWQYAGGVNPNVLATDAAFSSRYPAKPAAGVVYGVNHYTAALGGNTTLTQAAVTLLTISMPVAGVGALLDISCTNYMNTTVIGHGGGLVTMWVNGVQVGPTIVIPDVGMFCTWSGRIVNVVPPTTGTYNIEMKASKINAGGTIAAQVTNTVLNVVSYRL